MGPKLKQVAISCTLPYFLIYFCFNPGVGILNRTLNVVGALQSSSVVAVDSRDPWFMSSQLEVLTNTIQPFEKKHNSRKRAS